MKALKIYFGFLLAIYVAVMVILHQKGASFQELIGISVTMVVGSAGVAFACFLGSELLHILVAAQTKKNEDDKNENS